MKRSYWLFLLTVSAAWPPEVARADIALYANRATWEFAVGTFVNLDFGPLNTNVGPNGLYGPGNTGFTVLGVGPIQLGPLTFTGMGQGNAAGNAFLNELQVLAPNFPGPHCLGGSACLQSTASGNFPILGEFSNTSVVIGLPQSTYAFGINLDNVDSEPTGTFVVTFPQGQTTPMSFTTNILSSTFFGFVSPSPISELDITEIASQGLGPFNMESPTFAVAPLAATPEPNVSVVLGPLLLLLFLLKRRACDGRRG